jgi:hypothetical protein
MCGYFLSHCSQLVYPSPLGPKVFWLSQFHGYENVIPDVYFCVSSNIMDRPNLLICHLIFCFLCHIGCVYFSLLLT